MDILALEPRTRYAQSMTPAESQQAVRVVIRQAAAPWTKHSITTNKPRRARYRVEIAQDHHYIVLARAGHHYRLHLAIEVILVASS